MKRAYLMILIWMIFLGTSCSGSQGAAEPAIPAVEDPEPAAIFYTLQADVYPLEGGLVYPAEAQAPASTTIDVKAIPVPGYKFEGWSGADTSTSPNLVLSMDGDRQLTAHFVLKLTPSPEPTLTPTPLACIKPEEVTKEDAGKSISVCGKVTNYGYVEDCPSCQYGKYSFIKLDNQFVIYSFNWEFKADWKGACLQVSDTVELYGVNPVFIFDKKEGEIGSDCKTERIEHGFWSNGITPSIWDVHRCPAGDYFQSFESCGNSHSTLPSITHFHWISINPQTD